MMQWVLRRTGPRPVVYERDHAIPALPVLLTEVARLRLAYDEALGRPEDAAASAATTRPEAIDLGDAGEPSAILRGIDAVIRAPSVDALDADARHWLQQQGLDDGSATALGAAGGPRLRVYRRLVRRGLRSVLSGLLPRTVAHLGEHRFDAEVDAWLADDPPTTRLLREVPGQFVAARTAAWRDDDTVAAHVADLAAFEVTLARLDAAPAAAIGDAVPLRLDAAVAWHPASAVTTYRFAVHEIEATTEATAVPCPTRLLSYRDPTHEIRHLSLGEVAAAVLTRLRDGAPLQDALRDGAAACGQDLDDTLLGRMSALLADLAERGVVRGGAS